MKRILVIQLERLGDLVQTTPLLQDLIMLHPDCPIDLIVLAGNEIVLTGMPNIGAIHTISEKLLIELNKEVEGCYRQQTIPPRSAALLAEFGLEFYDQVINFTHAAFGCWLTDQIEKDAYEGGIINGQGEWLFVGNWHVYLISVLDFREENHFNLVDIYRGSANGSRAPDSSRRPYCFQAENCGLELPEGRIIALNPGASNSIRRWPAAHFAELAERLAAHGFIPVLVGSPADREVCTQTVSRCSHPLPDFTGRTSVPQMAKLLSKTDLLVSNDTGAVHIAAAAGVPVVGLFGVSAFFRETSPWGEGHLILQSPLEKEGASLEKISPEVVCLAVLERLGIIPRENLRSALDAHEIPAWETFFLPETTDPLGGLSYRPVHSIDTNVEDLFCEVLRHYMAADMAGQEYNPQLEYLFAPAKQNHLHIQVHPTEIQSFKEIMQSMFIAPLNDMAEVAAAGRDLANQNNAEAAREIPAIGNLLESHLALLGQSAADFTWAKPVISYLNWKLRLLPQLDPRQLFKAHEQAYRGAVSVLIKCTEAIFSQYAA